MHEGVALGFREIEGLDGIVTVANVKAAARVYLCGGRIIDAEHDHQPGMHPRDVLTELLSWEEGELSFVCIPVHRTDRFEMGTQALLMDLAREQDERVA